MHWLVTLIAAGCALGTLPLPGLTQAIPRPRIEVSGSTPITEGEARKITCFVDSFSADDIQQPETLKITIHNNSVVLASASEIFQPGGQVSKELRKENQEISRHENNGGDLHCTVMWRGVTHAAYLKDPDQQNITVYYTPYTSALTVQRLGHVTEPEVAQITCSLSPSNPVVDIRWLRNYGIPDEQYITDKMTTITTVHDDLSTESSILLTDEDQGTNLTCGARYSRAGGSFVLVETVVVDIAGLPFPPDDLSVRPMGISSADVTWSAKGQSESDVTWIVTLHQQGKVSRSFDITTGGDEMVVSYELNDLETEVVYTVEVYAKNEIGMAENVKTSFFIPQPEKSLPTVLIVGVVLGGVILALIIVIIVMLVRMRNKHTWQTDNSKRPLPEIPTPGKPKDRDTTTPVTERYVPEPISLPKLPSANKKDKEKNSYSFTKKTHEDTPVLATASSPATATASPAKDDSDYFYDDVVQPVDHDYEKPLTTTEEAKLKAYRSTVHSDYYNNEEARKSMPNVSTTGRASLRTFDSSKKHVSYRASELYEGLDDDHSTEVDALVSMLVSASSSVLPCKESRIFGPEDANIKPLHRGTFCLVQDVYSGDNKPTQVAKILKQMCSATESILFLRSIEALRQSKQHKNIVRAVSCSIDTKPRYLVMEKAEYGDLLSYLKKQKAVDGDTCKMFALAILDGLIYLHSLKPRMLMLCLNCHHVLLNKQKVCQLTNFGTEETVSTWHKYCEEKEEVPSVRWFAPESLSSGKHTPESDIWAFGLVIFEIYSKGNAIPFAGVKDKDMKKKAKSQTLEHELDFTSIPDKAQGLVKQLTHGNPEKRMKLLILKKSKDVFF